MGWFGLGKPRSKFGKWIDDKGITQEELSKKAGVSHETISRLARQDGAHPSWRTQKKLRETMREYDEEFSDDFWDG